MLSVRPIPAFRDNYIWLAGNGRLAIVVDPGDADPVLETLARDHLELVAVLITHHHSDHVGGIAKLLSHYPVPVYGPAAEAIPHLSHPLHEADTVRLGAAWPIFTVLEVPGHTAGHIAYHGGGALFCGDTLFGGGCGRLFEGTAAQMHASLTKLAGLPDDTLVYCAHEYTRGNLRFALAVEPGNPDLQARLREVEQQAHAGQPTVPSRLGTEKLTNPFLRCQIPAVIAAAQRHTGTSLNAGAAVFGAIRYWKDTWSG